MVPLVIVTGCGFNHLEKYEFINGKDYPIYYGKYKMFETTNQVRFQGTNWWESIRNMISNGTITIHITTIL
jgi:lipoprotein-anchoring transpeptidase ErfK/SrfK